jgi:hypothetical protein
MAVVLNPLVKWAQNRNLVYLTVELSDVVVNSLEIQEKTLKFEGTKTRGFVILLNYRS